MLRVDLGRLIALDGGDDVDDLSWDDLHTAVGEDEFVPGVCQPEEPYCLLYTSGTTGRPKGVVTPHRMVAWNAYNTVACWQLNEDDVSPIFTPLYHAGGLGAFLMSNPCNPTGQVIRGGALRAMVDVCRQLHCSLIVDEFYSPERERGFDRNS